MSKNSKTKKREEKIKKTKKQEVGLKTNEKLTSTIYPERGVIISIITPIFLNTLL